jgi:aldose 1-epimerase
MVKPFVLAGFLAMATTLPASAQQYAARHTGDVVQLEDTKNQTVVSIIPSVGNIAFEMKVKGINVLRWPYASVEDFKARPGLSAIPFLAPWANRLDEQAFYANGKRYAFDMDLGNVRGAIPIHGFTTTNVNGSSSKPKPTVSLPGSPAGSTSTSSRCG